MTTHRYTVNMPAHPSVIFAANNLLNMMPDAVDFFMWATGTGRVAVSLVVNADPLVSTFAERGVAHDLISDLSAMATRVGGTFTALTAGPPLIPA